MKILVIGFGLLISINGFCQKSPIKYGVIPMEDMTMTRYAGDSSAAAVVLADYGETNGMAYEHHVRMKILSKDGLNWANVGIQIGNKTRISSLKASTYNLEAGTIVKTEMTKEGIFRESITKDIDAQKFTLPNVKEGSVIEYSYKINGMYLPEWEFQKRIPVRWSEFWAIIPDFFIFEKLMQGYLPPTTFDSKSKVMTGYQAQAFHWTMKEVPAFKAEPFLTTEDDYISKVNFSLTYVKPPGAPAVEFLGSWASFNSLLLESDIFGKVITKSGFLKERTVQIIAGIDDPYKKIEAIHAYVRQTMEWDGRNGIACDDLKDAVEKKSGNCSDINFMLAAMLHHAGFMVDMVVLSTRDHGFVRPNFLDASQFNYVVAAVRVDGKPTLLDATEKELPYTILPKRCLNGAALMISNIASNWFSIHATVKAKTAVNADLNLNSNGEMEGKLQFTYEGYDAQEARKNYRLKGEESYTKSIFNSQTGQVQKSEFSNLKELNLPFKQTYDVAMGGTTTGGGIIYIDPIMVSRENSNPFRSEKREYPVYFGSPIDKTYNIRITLPDGYVVDELPKSTIMRLHDNSAKFVYSATQAGNIVSVTSNFQIASSMYLPDIYPDLREFYNQIIAKQSEQIVLKRKEK